MGRKKPKAKNPQNVDSNKMNFKLQVAYIAACVLKKNQKEGREKREEGEGAGKDFLLLR